MYCPTFGATYCTLGQIERLILDDEVGGAERIRKGFRLAPCDPIACLAAGCLDIEEGEVEQSFEKLKKAVQLDYRLFKGIFDVYIRVDRLDLAIALADDNTDRLSYVAGILIDMDENEELVATARTKVMDLLKEKCLQPNAPASAFMSLANIYRKQQDNKSAIEYYRRALALDYGQVRWRFTLAKLLAEMERIPEAMQEARICLRLRPQFKAAKELIAELSVHPKMLNEEGSMP
jgi:tetratricopeptide (TPR) repeat protein